MKVFFNVVFLFVIISYSNLFSQSFTFNPHDTLKNEAPGVEIVFDIPITNISTDTISICVVRRANDLPADWTSSFCFDESCFPPFLDSIATTPDFNSSPIAPNETLDFSVHIWSDTVPNVGYMTLVAKQMKRQDDSIRINLTASSLPNSVKSNIDIAGEFNLYQNYPNPFNPQTTIAFYLDKEANVKITLTDVLGNSSELFQQQPFSVGMHTINFNSGNLTSGVYFYTISASYSNNETKTITKKMILEK